MSAREEIIDVVTRLFVATDKRDWDAVRACFTTQVQFDMTSLAGGEPSVKTPDEIASGWEQGLASIEHVHHQAGNFIVHEHVNAIEADVFCYGVAYHHTAGRTRMFVGSYNAHVVHAHGEWKIDRFRYNSKFVDG